jgi:glycosyltransferase involved in cell wall biosynthesis
LKVLLLSDTYSEHTEKWALGLAEKGIKIGLFSFNKASYEWYHHPNITLFYEPESKINAESTLTKLSYFKYVSIIKKIIKHFQPDILHAHYATSYGMVGALSAFHPFVLSVWGSDVYDFPTRSKLHRNLFQYNLKKADVIMSTSEVMKTEVNKYTKKPVTVTPFGVDCEVFKPMVVTGKDNSLIHVGTIKPIEEKYGITFIIDAAKILVNKYPQQKFKFYLIGPGTDLPSYQKEIAEKGLESIFELTGRIPFDQINRYHNLLDIFLNVSVDDSESFGVAAVESMACEKPVVVSDVGGLMEVVNNGEFGLVVPKKDAAAIAQAVEKIIGDKAFAINLGKKARQHVLKKYAWQQNLSDMVAHYQNALIPSKK